MVKQKASETVGNKWATFQAINFGVIMFTTLLCSNESRLDNFKSRRRL